MAFYYNYPQTPNNGKEQITSGPLQICNFKICNEQDVF